MKFDDHFVDQVRNAADIVRVVGEYVRLRKAGANYLGLCPFHSEKTPSFSVHEGKQFFHCFGCHASGDVFKFVQQMEHVTFPESLKLLANKFGVPIPEMKSSAEADENAKERQQLLEINQEATAIFKRNLASGGEGRQALGYLKSRGVSDAAIEAFDLGYAAGNSDFLLRQLRSKFSMELLQKSGLVQISDRDGSYFDRFRRRIIFPIRNEAGKIIAFGGRIMGEGQPKYLNSPESPLYSKSRTLYGFSHARKTIQDKKMAILVEGYMDCIALHQAGVTNAVASCGTSLTEMQAKLLGRFAEGIVVNFDPDLAGASATLRSLNIFLENGFKIRVLALPGKEDPDEYVKKQGVEAYCSLLDKAPTYFDYLLELARQANNLRTIEGKVAAVESMLPYLVRLSNRIERLEQTKKVAEYFHVEESNIREELKRAATHNREKLEISKTNFARQELKPLEKYLLRAILENEPAAVKLRQKLLESEDFKGLPSEPVFRAILELHKEKRAIDINALENRLTEASERDFLNQALFAQLDWVQAQGSLERIAQLHIKQEIASLQKQIEEADKSKDFQRLATLLAMKSELSLKRER